MRTDVPLGPLEHAVERIPGAILLPRRGVRARQPVAVAGPPRHDVRVHVRDALPRVRTVLHRDGERGRARVRALEGAPDARDDGEQVPGFGGGEVAQARDAAEGRDEDVAGEDRLEVDEGEGVGCFVEDLRGALAAGV